ncbi:MAG: hypothetical protein IPM82_09945 [Saprospiraceae bacterium]|nr:hypothetical protein [Saprospiraceae bacterium]
MPLKLGILDRYIFEGNGGGRKSLEDADVCRLERNRTVVQEGKVAKYLCFVDFR